ncbi:type II CAAX endopeptidase family protein [uncultured Gilvimarinus sp.]|uniref:CPBP family intramembrane glutamic endopeptidase n=1 Tax=uncultured Gilvimarinus sp. TaxID=1689143 RepID=UPI0030EC1EEC
MESSTIASSGLTQGTPRFDLKARYLVAVWLLSFVVVPGYSLLAGWLYAYDVPWYWYDLLYYACFYGLLCMIVAIQWLRGQSACKTLFARPAKRSWTPALLLTALSFSFATVAFYGVFIPLSYWLPDFVQYWVIELPWLIYFTPEGEFPLLPNLLNLLFLVVIPPLVEEFVFRGILLHRWAPKYGVLWAVFGSSVIFGALHTDPLGAAVFGAIMCFIYLKSGSLWVPIVCHALNNLVCWLWDAADLARLGLDYEYTLKAFRDEWSWALVAAVITLVLWALYRKHGFAKGPLKLPASA